MPSRGKPGRLLGVFTNALLSRYGAKGNHGITHPPAGDAIGQPGALPELVLQVAEAPLHKSDQRMGPILILPNLFLKDSRVEVIHCPGLKPLQPGFQGAVK